MGVHKIVIAPSLYEQLGLVVTTFHKREDAIVSIKKALVNVGRDYTTTDDGAEFIFLNSVGGELAKVIKA
ncbi:MAG: hypothetical protein C0623_13595 [Desulfuromonas sp.]|nr:MAG: hypothetical protein C0623_13595 [Desulfuromonas sp.]